MPIPPLALVVALALHAAEPPAPTPPSALPAAPGAVNGARAASAETYRELARIADAFSALVDTINAESGSENEPKLRVAFDRSRRGGRDRWPDDFAPRDEYIKLADRAVAEAEAQGLIAAFAKVASNPSIEFPPHDHTAPPALKLRQIREMLRMHEYMLERTTEPAKAVDLLTPCFDMGRLLATAGGVVSVVALEAFHDDTGAYPDALTALVPKHLDAVPPDPGDLKSPLIYRKGEVKVWGRTYPYVLYSRGGDGVENGGVAMREPALSLWGGVSYRGKDMPLNALRPR